MAEPWRYAERLAHQIACPGVEKAFRWSRAITGAAGQGLFGDFDSIGHVRRGERHRLKRDRDWETPHLCRWVAGAAGVCPVRRAGPGQEDRQPRQNHSRRGPAQKITRNSAEFGTDQANEHSITRGRRVFGRLRGLPNSGPKSLRSLVGMFESPCGPLRAEGEP